MKILSCAFLLMAGLAFVLSGCSDNSSPIATPSSTSSHTPPSLQKTDGPGAWIVRYEDVTGWFFFDFEAQLWATIGIHDLEDLCSGGGSFDMRSYKEIWLPNGDPELRRLILQTKGRDLFASVYRLTFFPETGDEWCALFGSTPIATGTVNFSTHDNDVNWWQDTPNSNTYGEKAEGRLAGSEGQAYQFNLVWRVTWDGDDGSRANVVTKILLVPTKK